MRVTLWGILLAISLLAVVVVYRLVDPMSAKWLPKCPFHSLTGLDCPACGNQRALHSMLNGKFVEAWRFNPFLILSLPYLFLLTLAELLSLFTDNRTVLKVKRFTQCRPVVLTYLVAVCLWWFIRNL